MSCHNDVSCTSRFNLLDDLHVVVIQAACLTFHGEHTFIYKFRGRLTRAIGTFIIAKFGKLNNSSSEVG